MIAMTAARVKKSLTAFNALTGQRKVPALSNFVFNKHLYSIFVTHLRYVLTLRNEVRKPAMRSWGKPRN